MLNGYWILGVVYYKTPDKTRAFITFEGSMVFSRGAWLQEVKKCTGPFAFAPRLHSPDGTMEPTKQDVEESNLI